MKQICFLLLAAFSTMNIMAGNVITYSADGRLPLGNYMGTLRKNAFDSWVEEYTFSNGLGTITFSSDVTIIGDFAFEGCSDLTSVTIPNSVKSIGRGAFSECYGLTSVIIPNGVTNIGVGAFYRCANLTSVTIPSSVTDIGEGAFVGCNGLKLISVSPDNSSFDSRYNCNAIVRKSDNMLICGCKNTIIPRNVKKIGNYAFSDCSGLSSITIPGNVTSIGKWAFSFCTDMVSITIPNSVTSIDDNAFYGCEKLTSIIIPSSVKIIGKEAFSGCPSNMIIHISPDAQDRFLAMESLKNKRIIVDAPSAPVVKAQPPLLTLVENSLQFIDANGNKVIDANEACKIRFQVTNRGKSPAQGCKVKVQSSGSVAGIKYSGKDLHQLSVGATQTIEIPVTANLGTEDGQVTFSIEVTEPNGFGIDPMTLTVNTRAFDAPLLKVVDYAVSGSGTLRKKVPFDLQLLLQNTKYGMAEDVNVSISLPTGVLLNDGQEQTHYETLKGGDKRSLDYELVVSGNYSSTTVPIRVTVSEKYGRYAENRIINLQLDQQLTSSTAVVLHGEQRREQREAIQIGALGSDVDRNIPVTGIKNPNTFVVIIANEQYHQVANVPFALNDGNVFAQYCEKTLGISPKHIHYIPNATLNQMKAQVSWLQNMTDAWDDARVIFYYTGHGIPEESSRTSYLLPVDGYGSDVSTGYKLDDLYAALGNMPTNHITVFLDACFSGVQRSGEMLASAKGVALKARPGAPRGKMVVFSAAQADETAMFYQSQQHGLFTYFLLKKLQETNGDVDLQTLSTYIHTNVRRAAMDENEKPQTPTITPAAAVADEWGGWKLK